MAIIRGPLYLRPWYRDPRFRWLQQFFQYRNIPLLQPVTTGCYVFRDSDSAEPGTEAVTFNLNLGGPTTVYVFIAVFQQGGGSYTVQVNGQNLTKLLEVQPSSPGTTTLWGGSVTLGSDPNSVTWTVSGGSFTTRLVHAWTITAVSTTPLDIKAIETLGTTQTTFSQSGDAIIAGVRTSGAVSSNFDASTETPAGQRAEVGSSSFGLTSADWTTVTNGTFSAIAANSGVTWISRWRCTALPSVTVPGQFDYPLSLSRYAVPAQSVPTNIALLSTPVVVQQFMPGQYDYPLPPQPPRLGGFWASTPTVSLTPVVQAPFNLEDWPVPAQPARVYARSFGLNLATTVQPFAQDIWPVPVQLQRVYTLPYSAPVALLTAAVQTPFNLEDWPSPRLPFQPPSARTWLQQGIKELPALPPSSEWTQIVPPYRVYAASYSTPITLISAPAQAPFSLEDWPVPRQPYRVYAEVRRADIGLLHSVQPPNRLDQWPVSTQPYRVYAQSYATPLPLVTIQPFNQEDWPQPIRPPIVYSPARGMNFALLHSIQPPISQTSWPKPIDPYRVYAVSYSTPTTLFAAPDRAFAETDWPVPVQPYRVYADVRRASMDLLHSVQPPTRLDHWPVPVQPYRGYAPSYSTPLTAITVQPFNLEDWPLPVRPPIVYSPAVGANMKLLHSVQPPISQSDWPQPVRPYIVRSVSYGTPATLFTAPDVPFSQEDWPVPKQPYRVYAEARSADIRVLHSAKPPNRQDHWPQQQRPPTRGLTWTQSLTALQLQKPFAQTDWPLPKRLPVPTANRTFLHRAFPSTIFVPSPPIRQPDWPRPKSINEFWPVSARTWVGRPPLTEVPITITPAFWANTSQFFAPSVLTEPGYDFPVGRKLDSDYGIRGSKLGRHRLVIGRR